MKIRFEILIEGNFKSVRGFKKHILKKDKKIKEIEAVGINVTKNGQDDD